MGSKNHEVVPSTLIAQVSGLRNGGVNKILGALSKRNLVAKVQNSKCALSNLTACPSSDSDADAYATLQMRVTV